VSETPLSETRSEKEELEAVFLYMGILDAYEAVGTELIGPTILDEHVIPRMGFYVREFLPELYADRKVSSTDSTDELKAFVLELGEKVNLARQQKSAQSFTMEEIWELRAAIFGYESVFIDLLGEVAIKTYVFKRIADILSAYLPRAFVAPDATLQEKLDAYVSHIRDRNFVGYAQATVRGDRIEVIANRCAFSRIHDSNAYRNAYTRFCPWGMIGSAILTSHEGKETSIDSCVFTTSGSISRISTK
jgi:hypothetical protein